MKNLLRDKETRFMNQPADAKTAQAFRALYRRLKVFNKELPAEVMVDMASYGKFVVFKKNEVLWDYGELCDHMLFCNSGLVTSLVKKEKGEYHSRFLKEGDVIISVSSFFEKTPSDERLVALEETECIALHTDAHDRLMEQHPSYMEVERSRLGYLWVQADISNKRMLLKPKDRFHHLHKQYPFIAKRVERPLIASHLGVSLAYLTRMMG